jgi:hypothetical protein
MAADRVVVREIAWRDVFPWLIIFRTFGLAKSMPVLFLATLGALATPVGWRIAEGLFLDEQAESQNLEFSQIVFQNRSWPGIAGGIPIPNDGRLPSSAQEVLVTAPDCVQPVFLRFVQPLAELTDPSLPVTHAAYFAFGLLWTLFVWGLFGGAVSRIAAVRLGREERISLGEALRHAVRRLGAHVASPLFPLLGVGLVMLPILGVGFLMRWDWGVLLAGLLWIIVLLGGLFITILLLGLLFGWPLMWATIASEENGDAFEAFSRSYSYTFQRPLHYLFYALVATLFGGFSWLLVYHFSEGVIAFAQWPAALGAGADRWSELARSVDSPQSATGLAAWGVQLVGWCVALVRSVATGFAYSLFWCMATAIYLLLRQDVDQTEFDDVYVENEDLQYVLPPLDADGAHAKGGVDDQADSAPAGAAATEPPETSSSDGEGAAERT